MSGPSTCCFLKWFARQILRTLEDNSCPVTPETDWSHPCTCRRISHYMIDNGGDGQMTPLLRLAAGAGAGIVGMSATYPLDMVSLRYTRIQHETSNGQ